MTRPRRRPPYGRLNQKKGELRGKLTQTFLKTAGAVTPRAAAARWPRPTFRRSRRSSGACRPMPGRRWPSSDQARDRRVQQGRQRRDGDRALHADQLVPTGELFRALQAGTIDAVQSRRRLDGARPSTSRCSAPTSRWPALSLDVPVLWNRYGLEDIWSRKPMPRTMARSPGSDRRVGPCNFATTKPIRSLADLKGLRVFTFPTAGRFLARFGVVPVTCPARTSRWRSRRANSTASPGRASPRTTPSAGPT